MNYDPMKAVLAEYELGVVIRSHLYIEAALDELISLLLIFPEELEKMNLTFANKVRLACAASFDKDYKSMLLALGSIRNKFSHNVDTKLDQALVRDLHSKLNEISREHLPEALRAVAGEKEVKPFNQHHPRDQFSALAISLWTVLNLAIREVKEHRGA